MAALAASSSSTEWSALDWQAFPPLYTLQPVAETRRQQLKVWVELVHHWAVSNGTFTFAPSGCGVFSNVELNRALDAAGIEAVVAAVVADGRGEVLEDGQLFLMASRPVDVARELYEWAKASDKLGSVYTVLELYDADAADDDCPCRGSDPRLVFKALGVLEDQDRCQVFHGATSSDAGVKFFRE